ncbi:YqhG family protein [Virgibacillus senegalensis]|uniref:YqhG family protein n=1 Tax=Virgibacillus senegalensis TaxID=1499679 RepID=UPI00069F2456|nr:YqhG family protein [Virgibacillus senegalensis]
MAIENLHNFITEYFLANQCELLENENGKVTIQLTDKMDELIMNRPFYWHYIKQIGQQGQPMKITFITNPDRQNEQGEWLHFGSPRLHQIFRTLASQGKMTRQYEQTMAMERQPLIPWLLLNIKVSYQGKHKKDELLSYGLQLINGTMVSPMMEKLTEIRLQPVIPDYCYTISPLIHNKSAYQRLIRYVQDYLRTKDYTWAKESWDHLYAEGKLLEHFYTGEKADEEKQRELQQALKEIESRFRPRISIDMVNGGLFYLTQESSARISTYP